MRSPRSRRRGYAVEGVDNERLQHGSRRAHRRDRDVLLGRRPCSSSCAVEVAHLPRRPGPTPRPRPEPVGAGTRPHRRAPPRRRQRRPPAAARGQARRHRRFRPRSRRYPPRGVLGLRRRRRTSRSSSPLAASVPLSLVARRLRIEVPFLAFAVFLPIVGTAPRVEVLVCIAVGAGAVGGVEHRGQGHARRAARAIVLAATTPVTELLTGLDRLRVPRVLTAIAGFMVRYLDVIVGEAERMRDRPPVPGRRPPVALAGPGHRLVGRHAVRPLVRAGRTGAPGDDLAWLRRHDA